MTCTEFRRGTSTFAWILARDRHFRYKLGKKFNPKISKPASVGGGLRKYFVNIMCDIIIIKILYLRETPMYREVVVRAKELYGLDPTAPQVIEVSHEDCTWDYIEYCEDKDCENLKPDEP